ncbi:uncharacterized protein G2W53_008912 [Senna tora]|uniref:Uncharacterized protein n=1 Tax=Senna tora TaxID=362788 RepID=A0A834WWT1_9FABA|nr:uncharacterized protein G2W53_008912 [Senna tora]
MLDETDGPDSPNYIDKLKRSSMSARSRSHNDRWMRGFQISVSGGERRWRQNNWKVWVLTRGRKRLKKENVALSPPPHHECEKQDGEEAKATAMEKQDGEEDREEAATGSKVVVQMSHFI